MTAEILSVGTELLMGNILNTNAQYISQKLCDLGINCYFQTTVGDNHDRLVAAVDLALSRADLLILTGGLGLQTTLPKKRLRMHSGWILYLIRLLKRISAHALPAWDAR